MRKSIVLLAVLFTSVLTACSSSPATPTATASAPDAGVEPRIVLYERNPWLMVIGSDSPSFALYADGLVIFRKAGADGRPRAGGFVSARLTGQELQDLTHLLDAEALDGAEDHYELTYATDQTNNALHVWRNGARKDFHIYGSLETPRPPQLSDYKEFSTSTNGGPSRRMEDHEIKELLAREHGIYERDMELRNALPKPLLETLTKILAFDRPAKPWLPTHVEVFIWPYDHSPEEPMPWPTMWPSISEAEHGQNDYHKFTLPIAEYERLLTLMRTRGAKQAVFLEGRKWSVAYRLPFPGESTWNE